MWTISRVSCFLKFYRIVIIRCVIVLLFVLILHLHDNLCVIVLLLLATVGESSYVVVRRYTAD